MKKIFLFIAFVGIITACENRSLDKSSFQTMASLKERIFKYGDKKAYEELKTLMVDYPVEDMLFWSLIMANKHSFHQANLDVFYAIVLGYVSEIDRFYEMDERSQALAKGYLVMAKDQGVAGASEIYNDLQAKIHVVK